MDLSLNSAQLMIQDAARGFVQRQAPRDRLVALLAEGRTWDEAWLPQLGRAGWLGLLVPEEFDGAGVDPLSAVLFFEQLGRGAVPGPMLSSSAIAVMLLRAATRQDARDALLTGIAEGSAVVSAALRTPERSWRGALGSPTPLAGGPGDRRLTGTSVFVPYADTATHFLVSVTAEGSAATLAIVPATAAGVTVRRLSGFAHASFEVVFTATPVADADLLRTGGAKEVDDAMATARLAVAGYQVGGCAALLDMCVAYSSSREQFGVPIGRFQRVQDHIIRLLNGLDAARWMTYEAAWAVESDSAGAARSYLAAATASEAFVDAADAAHEVHAGIGSDPAFGMTLYTQASRTLYELLGAPEWQCRQFADSTNWTD
jgi:alkylation response protein AidB-like acyl-CoA dehydrogenase